VGVEAGLTCTV